MISLEACGERTTTDGGQQTPLLILGRQLARAGERSRPRERSTRARGSRPVGRRFTTQRVLTLTFVRGSETKLGTMRGAPRPPSE
jgi:hypothetical protein